jgi:hypothetical protein
MKLSQSPEAMEIKRRLWEGMGLPLPLHLRRPTIDAAEHNRRRVAAAAQEELERRAREMPLVRMQQLLDQGQRAYLERLRELEAEAARSCHRGPSDPDWAA